MALLPAFGAILVTASAWSLGRVIITRVPDERQAAGEHLAHAAATAPALAIAAALWPSAGALIAVLVAALTAILLLMQRPRYGVPILNGVAIGVALTLPRSGWVGPLVLALAAGLVGGMAMQTKEGITIPTLTQAAVSAMTLAILATLGI